MGKTSSRPTEPQLRLKHGDMNIAQEARLKRDHSETPKNPQARRKILALSLAVLVIFTALAIVLTYPLTADITHNYFNPSGSHDGVGTIAQTWYSNYSREQGWSGKTSHFFGYPFGYDQTTVNYPFTNGVMSLVARAFGPQASYNLLVIISFPMAGLTMFLLIYYITGAAAASFLGGLIYSFSPWHTFRTFDQVSLAQIYILPLFLLSLLYLWKKRTALSALWVCIALAVAILTDYHFGLFCGFILITWALASWITDRRSSQTPSRVTRKSPKIQKSTVRLGLLLVVAIVIAIVVCAPFLKNLLYKDPSVISDTGERSTDTVISYSAHPWNYVVPPSYSLLWHGLTNKFVSDHVGKSGVHEVTDYAGIVAFFLAGAAIFYTFRRKRKRHDQKQKDDEDDPAASDTVSAGVTNAVADTPASPDSLLRKAVSFGIIAAIAAFVLSMPPIVKLGSVSIPTPSIVMRVLAPPFRFYSRWALVVVFSLALLAGIGFFMMSRSRNWSWKKTTVWCLIFAALFALDATIVPPFRSRDIAKPPATVAALAQTPVNQPVAFYPLSPGRYFIPLWYRYYQIVHKHPMLNGSKPGTLGDLYDGLLKDIYAPYTPAVLSGLGIKKVAVIDSYYRIMFPVGLDFDPAKMPAGYKLDTKTKDGYIFDVVAAPAKVAPLYYVNFTAPAIVDDGQAWSVMIRPKAEMLIDNRDGKTRQDFDVLLNNPGDAGVLSAKLDGKSLGESRIAHGQGELHIPGMNLDSGRHTLAFEWKGKPVRMNGNAFGAQGTIDAYLLMSRPNLNASGL